MLSIPERIFFLLGALLTTGYALYTLARLMRVIGQGHGDLDWRSLLRRLPRVIIQTISLSETFKSRRRISILQGLVAWGLLSYILINLGDVLEGFFPDFTFFSMGTLGGLYRLSAEVVSVFIIAVMLLLLLRRFFFPPSSLSVQADIELNPMAYEGLKRDPLIVWLFILFHVSARLLGQSFKLASSGMDDWQPLTMNIATLWQGFSSQSLSFLIHGAWWASMGSILLFIPHYFRSKHLHLLIAPLNLLF